MKIRYCKPDKVEEGFFYLDYDISLHSAMEGYTLMVSHEDKYYEVNPFNVADRLLKEPYLDSQMVYKIPPFSFPIDETDKMMLLHFGTEWYTILNDFLKNPNVVQLVSYMHYNYKSFVGIQPSTAASLFRAFRMCNPFYTKVIFIGQDPYPNGEATGIAFASQTSTPSLLTMEKTMKRIEGHDKRLDYMLSNWTKTQQFLMLNRNYTLNFNYDWLQFNMGIIKRLNTMPNEYIYLLCGKKAQELSQYINIKKDKVYKVEHPIASARDGRSWDAEKPLRKIKEVLSKYEPFNYLI